MGICSIMNFGAKGARIALNYSLMIKVFAKMGPYGRIVAVELNQEVCARKFLDDVPKTHLFVMALCIPWTCMGVVAMIIGN